MRIILIILTVFWHISCNPKPAAEVKSDINIGDSVVIMDTHNFDWITGKWKRLSEDTLHLTFEYWTKESETQYSGHVFIMKGIDTLWQEKMELLNLNSRWSLSVRTPGNRDKVSFLFLN